MVIVMATVAEQAQVTNMYMVTSGMTSQSQIILEYAFVYDLLLYIMYLKKRNSHFIIDRSGNTVCVISKGPVTDMMVPLERRLLCSH